jgi:hypothetical protein
LSQRHNILRASIQVAAIFVAMTGQSHGQTSDSWVIGGQTGEPWADAAKQWIALDDSVNPGAVQPLQISHEFNVMRETVRSAAVSTQRNLFGWRWTLHKGPRLIEADTLQVGWHPRLWNAGAENAKALSTELNLVDGDEITAALSFSQNSTQKKNGTPSGIKFMTFDLGVSVPIDSVVFFPPQSGITEGQRSRELFPINFEISRSNTPAEWLIFEDETTSIGSGGYHPLDEVIGATFANNSSVVSLTPPPAFTRFLRFRVGQEMRTVLMAEFKAFGRGYPQEARYVSEPHFFGTPVSFGSVTWNFTRYRQAPSGEIVEDPTAPVELVLRTRAGGDSDPMAYFIFDDLGRPLRVESIDYFKAPAVEGRFSEGVPGFRASRDDDTENWNNWSVAYEHSGAQNKSSDGSKYLQFEFQIVTEDPLTFGVLDSLSFEVSPLLADSALAEVSLDGSPVTIEGQIEVPLGVDTLFVYDLRTVAGDDALAGYDGLELLVPAAARFVDLEVDGIQLTEGVDFELAEETGRIVLLFPQSIQTDTAMRVRFRSAIFQASIFLEGRIFNQEAGVRLPQSVEAGNARTDVSSNDVQVIASDTRFGVLRQVSLSTPVITPNGDGANDEVAVIFDLYGVQDSGLSIEIYDLAGRRVRVVMAGRAESGPFAPTWDGKDDAGEAVAPGLYLIRVEVDVDDGTLARIQPVAVAY